MIYHTHTALQSMSSRSRRHLKHEWNIVSRYTMVRIIVRHGQMLGILRGQTIRGNLRANNRNFEPGSD